MINNVLLDEKGRIYIPKSSMLRESEKILLKRENDLTFSLYDFNEFNKRIELLKSKREEAFEQGDIQKFELISNYINLKIIDVFYEIKKDSQDRILLPKKIRQMYEIEKSILLFELLDRVNVFKNFEQCNEYKRELSKKFSYIC